MSVRVQSAVWEHSRATGNALLVLLKIADNCDDDGRNAWPSLPSLARYCRCSVSTVQRSIRELEDLGELEVVRRGGGPKPGTRYAPNLYRVYPQGGQSDTSQEARDWSNSASRLVKNGDRDWSPVTGDPSLDPSLNAQLVENHVDHAAYVDLCRGLLLAKGPSQTESCDRSASGFGITP